MKRFLLLGLCLSLLSTLGFSQEKYATYLNTYVDKEYDISVSFTDGKTSLYIDLLGLDKLRDKGGISIDDKTYLGFIDNLNSARLKYEEWINVAKQNDVKELSKQVELKSQIISGYFISGGKYTFDFSVRPTFNFRILDDEKGLRYLMLVRTGELQSSSNQYTKADDFVLVFTSLQEMDEFIDLISLKKLEEFKNKSADKSSLFKN